MQLVDVGGRKRRSTLLNVAMLGGNGPLQPGQTVAKIQSMMELVKAAKLKLFPFHVDGSGEQTPKVLVVEILDRPFEVHKVQQAFQGLSADERHGYCRDGCAYLVPLEGENREVTRNLLSKNFHL